MIKANDKRINYVSGWIFFCAFCSLYIQYPGLYGVNGILPIQDFLNHIEQHLNGFAQFPSILRYADAVGVSLDAWGEFLLIVGMCLSLVICLGIHRPILFTLLWLLYLSFYLAGQTFLSFQWDILLLEYGFLIALNSFLQSTTTRLHTMNWCFRFVIWKLMFMAGVVKLQSKCPTWEHLTALEVRSDANLSVPLSDFLHIYTVPFCYAVPSQCNCVVCPSSPPPSPAHWGSRHTAH